MTIEAKNLLKIYGKRRVVNDVDINVQRGEVVGLLGPNGAGKTTTFYMVVGLIKPNKGSITLDGKNISKMPMYKRARLGLGYLPQEASVFRKLTVEQNITAIWELRGGAPVLSVKEKVELILRKSERAWWNRPKYEENHNAILEEKKISELQLKNITSKYSDLNLTVKNTSDKLFYLIKILETLDINIEDIKEDVKVFLSDYNKFYLLGKKKKLHEFLGNVFKIKRDKLLQEFKEAEDFESKKKIIIEVCNILDIDFEVVSKEFEEFPEVTNANEFIDLINNLELAYWKKRKSFLMEKEEDFKRLNILKKSKLQEDLKLFLTENNLKEKEINDALLSLNWSRRQSKNFQLEDILDEFNISHIRYSKGSDLSGGERRRVEIARAVANKPSFLLLDEPFAGIDPIAVSGIKDMISLLKNRNIGVLITDHNVRETLKIIDRGYILSDGKILEQGTKDHLANSEVARKHYLGEDFSLH
jgi:ABC-type lipopolysaccharide export system ATPase subunit